MPMIETKTSNIFYADHHKGDGTPLILIHGAGGSHLDWPAAMRRLPDVLAVDLPGHGKSPLPGRSTITDYARDVIAFMDALNVHQAIITGHSMGGGIAQQIALDAPDRVRGLVLIGTGAKLGVHPFIMGRILTAPGEVASLLKGWMWSDSVPQQPREITYNQLMSLPPEVAHGDYLACNAFDIRERLPEIKAPALVIGGSADKMTPHTYSVYLQEHLPHAELVTIEDGGHMMALEQPEAVAGAINTWLKTIR